VDFTPRPPLPQGEEGAEPPGWSYNPSAWRERRPLIALAALGFCAAVYTALYQLGIVPHLWDPFFGEHSSYLVTHSKISKLLPFPDGVLGIPGYLADLVFGSLGGSDRWRTRTWAVLAFAATISGLAMVSLLLTITMGVMVHAWCTVCLVSASVSTLIFGLGIGEALPALQYLKRVYERDHTLGSVWRALWGARKRPAREPRGKAALG
jgi:uncharacterized membrane protein